MFFAWPVSKSVEICDNDLRSVNGGLLCLHDGHIRRLAFDGEDLMHSEAIFAFEKTRMYNTLLARADICLTPIVPWSSDFVRM